MYNYFWMLVRLTPFRSELVILIPLDGHREGADENGGIRTKK